MSVWDQSVYEPKSLHITSQLYMKGRIYHSLQPTSLNHLIQQMADLPFCVPPITLTPNGALINRWYRNINLFSITYAFRPRLRDRLTLGRLTLPEETLGFRRAGFSPALSLLMSAWSLLSCPAFLTVDLQPEQNAPLPIFFSREKNPVASVVCFSPVTFSAQTHSTSELLRFL